MEVTHGAYVLTPDEVRHLNGATTETTWHEEFNDVRERYGASLRFLRHGDLHTGLLENLKATEGYPVKLNLGTDIAGIDCENGTIRKPDGALVGKDLVVLANGLGVRTSDPVKLVVLYD